MGGRSTRAWLELAELAIDAPPPVAQWFATELVANQDEAGDAPTIEQHAQRALELGGDSPRARRGGLPMLGWASYTAGDMPLAKQRFQESLAFRRSQGDRFGEAIESADLGDLAAEEGHLTEAARRLADALYAARKLKSTYMTLNLLPSIAAVAARSGDDEVAARLMGAADAMSRTSGLTPDPGEWQQPIGEAESRLGARFASLRSEGAVMLPDAAADVAARTAERIAAA